MQQPASGPGQVHRNVTNKTLSQKLIEGIESKTLSDVDFSAAALFTLDAVASMIAGGNSPPGRKLLNWAKTVAPNGDVAALDPARRGFLLGALCHILEMDDLHRASVVHPGCAVVPGAMLLGAGRPGQDVLKAVLEGFEAACRVGMAVGPAHYRRWHNTATCGPFGSAVAAGRLLNLDPDQLTNALGNAGSQSAGLWEFIETGAETKHLHAGRAAEAGIVAAQLASHGFTGAPAIFEGDRGFFAATCPDPQIDNLLAEPDAAWQVHKTSIKPWPSCRHTHPAIACALALHAKLGGPKDIQSIKVTTYASALDLCDRPEPDSVYAAKFSLHHCLAAALMEGKVDFASFEADARDATACLRGLTSINTGEPFGSNYPAHWGTQVTVMLKDGQSITEQVVDAKGDPESPLTRDELVGKSVDLMKFGGVSEAERLAEAVLAMAQGEATPDIMPFIGLLD